MNKRIFSSFVIVIIFLTVTFFLVNQSSNNFISRDIKYVKIAEQNIKVKLALTKEDQERGLSGQKELKEGRGMLFVFEKPGNHFFWMKDMNFPIDIIWLASFEGGNDFEAKIIYIKKDAQPESFPESYGPGKNAEYVLEVVSGFSEKNNLKEGDQVKFIYEFRNSQ